MSFKEMDEEEFINRSVKAFDLLMETLKINEVHDVFSLNASMNVVLSILGKNGAAVESLNAISAALDAAIKSIDPEGWVQKIHER